MTNRALPATRIVRVAVVQAAPVLFDTPRTLDKFADLTADAARQQAELVMFPEAFVDGYPKGHDFVRAKFDFDVVGHYARPDVFRLTVNEAAAGPVVFTTDAEQARPSNGSVGPSLTLLEVAGRFAVCQLPSGSAIPS